MARISCRELSPQLSSLPHRGTAGTTTHTQISFRRAESPCGPLTTTRRSQLPSAATRDDAAASLVGQLEHTVDQDEEEDGLYLPDDAPSVGRSGAQKHEGELAARWREIHGCDDWAGLLDPMDPLLRSELIRYGELAQACYDAFDYDLSSRYCGSCKYPRRAFFDRLGMPDAVRGYAVTRYLYATSNFRFPNFFSQQKSRADAKIWSQRANWIGYVAVSTDEESARLGRRDVAIAWRGTITRLEWVSDLMDYLRPVADEGIPCPDPEVKVESGFVDLYTDKDPSCRFCKYSAREQVLLEVRKLVDHYTALGEDVSISVTGHSLGSSLAVLSAYDIAESGANLSNGKRAAVCVYSFSGPRVGNRRFRERFEGELGVKALRVVNVHDNVPRMPGIFLNERVPEMVRRVAEGLRMPWCYSHVGVELVLDHKRSPFLKDTLDPGCSHNLEAHLHLLDGEDAGAWFAYGRHYPWMVERFAYIVHIPPTPYRMAMASVASTEVPTAEVRPQRRYHGSGERFVLASGRDPALVNKASDFLKDHHCVPPFWRQDENKGMVRATDGRWIQPDRRGHLDDDHHHDGHGAIDGGEHSPHRGHFRLFRKP